jgi:hypothetical protein
VVIANQQLDELSRRRPVAILQQARVMALFVEASRMVLELMNAARAKVLAASGNECLGTIARCDVAS